MATKTKSAKPKQTGSGTDLGEFRGRLRTLQTSGRLVGDELGRTGLKIQAGRADEEWNPKIKGRRGVLGFKEMFEQDIVVGTGFSLIELVVGRVPWRLDVQAKEGSEGSASAKAARDFVEECRNDMSHTWQQMVTDAVSGKLWAGFHFDEICYKRREGPDAVDPKNRSKFSDGKIGWAKFASRAQETLDRWIFDENDAAQAFVQRDPNQSFNTYTIPFEKGVLFRHRPQKNNPEGRSILRHAWTSYFTAKRIREDEAIGISRDFTGMPMFFIPPEYLSPNATPEQKALVDYLNTLMQQMQTGERNGAVLPSEENDAGNKTGFAFKLMASPGAKQHNSDAIIRRYEQAIAFALFVEFIMLGRDNVGSWALDEGKQTRFGLFVEGVLTEVRDVLQRFAIDRLCAINGIAPEDVPQLAFGEVRAPNLQELASILTAAHSIDALEVDDKLRDWIRKIAKLPEREKDSPEVGDDKRLEAALARAESRGDEKMAQAIREQMQRKIDMDPPPQDAPTTIAGATAVQDTALNGAQMTALADITERVVTGRLPKASALAMISASLPTLRPEKVKAIIDPLDEGSVNDPKANPPPNPGNPPAPPGQQTRPPVPAPDPENRAAA